MWDGMDLTGSSEASMTDFCENGTESWITEECWPRFDNLLMSLSWFPYEEPSHAKFSLRSDSRYRDSAQNLLYIVMAAFVLCREHWLYEDMKCCIWPGHFIPCFGFHRAGPFLTSWVFKVLRKTYAIELSSWVVQSNDALRCRVKMHHHHHYSLQRHQSFKAPCFQWYCVKK
jgi:hypothetical protein